MWIFSSYKTKLLLIVLLGLSNANAAKKRGFNTEDFISMLGDISSLESEEQQNILRSLNSDIEDRTVFAKKTQLPEDTVFAEESKKSILIRVQPDKSYAPETHQDPRVNSSNKNYDVVQWYTSPIRNTEHHIKGRKLDSSPDKPVKAYSNKHDLKAQGTTYSTSNYYHDSHEDNYDHDHDSDEHHHDNHYHVDHNAPPDSPDPNEDHKQFTTYHSQEEGKSYDNPSSDVFYKKMKLKKVRKNCTRSRNKKVPKWPTSSDTILRSHTHSVSEAPRYESKPYHSVPALPDARFNDASNFPQIPDSSVKPPSFSNEHSQDIPSTRFFQYKDGEGVNHYHLHNHHYHVNAKGERVRTKLPDYRNLANHFDKLKTILSTEEPGNPHPTPHSADNLRSTLSVRNLNSPPESGTEKRGYHYTGSHESYGRKTYKRIYPTPKDSPSSLFDSDKTFGMEMFRYGAGQYGTDEFGSNENKRPYPNEVTSGVNKPYSSSGEIYEPIRYKAKYNAQNSLEYNSDSPMTPYKPYSGEQDSSFNGRGKTRNYNSKQEDKAPYTPQKAPYTPQTYNDESTSAEYIPGYGPPSPNGHGSPGPFGADDGKSPPDGPSLDAPYRGNPAPPSLDVTHSISFSQDGEISNGPLNFAPEAPSLYLRPGPDPLTIPKNARVFEHHIRLHPMHYNLMALSRAAMNMPVSFSNAVYPVPLHKLISDPLKMPLVPLAPMHAAHMNQMLPQMRNPRFPVRYW